jgi:3alpha(or 20beta)-hydroxysteroid dehydrogenase
VTPRLAIVTGAASGIGRSIAEHPLGEDLRVVGLDIRPPPPFDTRRWTGFVCDVSDERAWAEVMDRIVCDLGAPDVLVNAAGISARSQQEPISAGAWATILRTNLISCWLGMRSVLPHMLARQSGSIVNIGALAAQQPFSVAALGGYAASKAGIEAITRATALESRLRGSRSTAWHPDPSRRRWPRPCRRRRGRQFWPASRCVEWARPRRSPRSSNSSLPGGAALSPGR